jgi:hypothetical protein
MDPKADLLCSGRVLSFMTHLGSKECIATTAAHVEFSRNTVEALLSQNMQCKATYLLGCSLSVDARQETDMPLVAFPA